MTATLNPDDAMLVALRGSLDDAAKLIGEQRERIKVLEAALMPFVEGANIYADESDADQPSHGRGWVKRRHLFAARKAMTTAERTKVDSQASDHPNPTQKAG